MHQTKVKYMSVFLSVVLLLILFNSTSSAQEIESLPPLKIVHLGDSYSAGNGARSESGDRNYYSVSGCYRSPTNWGSQFAESLADTFSVTYINRACSGGVIANILNDRDMGDTAFKRLDGSCPSPEYPDEELYKDTSALKCSRFVEPQIEAIDSSVDLVVMTIGGNDLGFDTLVTKCFAIGFRSPAGCREAVDEANARMETLEVDLTNNFATIRGKLRSDARIAYVSYPQILLDVPYQLSYLSGTPFEDIYDAGTELRSLGLAGEERQRAAVEAANTAAGEDYIVFYDGTKAVFEGHEPDPSVTQRNPDGWIYEFEGIKMVEWYHPNPLGHENWALALTPFETFGATGGAFGTNADVDVAFVVDTTGSMGGEITQVRADLTQLVNQLAATTDSYRVAVVSYRDFPQRTGSSVDYPFRVDQTFTDELSSIQAAINSLTANGGGDGPETVFSGIQAAIELPWRPGITKIAIVIGDAPALSPEPISNLTADQIVANSIAVDPVKVIGVNTGSLNSNGAVGHIADGTGGSVIQGTAGLTTKISEILHQAANQPFAWMGQAYSGKIGESILFDASGSYDPSGSLITLYEWDFDGDGEFDQATAESNVIHVYDTAYNGFVVLRVTGAQGTALASARTVVNGEGFASQGDEDSCELDENGFSIIVDEEGRFIPCTADSLPEFDQEGVTENSSNSHPNLNVIDDQFVQYSDNLAFDVSAIDPDNQADTLTFSAAGLPNDLVMTNNGDGTATVAGTVNAAPGNYSAEITVTDPNGLSDTKIVNIVVTQEDASATYTGPLMVSTSCQTCSTTVVPLRATIQDITEVDPGADPDPGSITNATVSFVDRANNAVLCTANMILLDAANQTNGTATCDWNTNIGSSNGLDYTIGIVVDGYYTRNSTEDDTVIVVSKPTSNFITGGGYFINQSSGGTYAGTPELKTNFGFNIKFTKKLTNLQGRVTIIVRQGERVYQIKSTALRSLVALPFSQTNPSSGTAELIGKVNITDVTDSLNPISLAGNATLNLVMKDNGEPGNADLISISLWSRNGELLFSSNWDGVRTILQLLDGGNLSTK